MKTGICRTVFLMVIVAMLLVGAGPATAGKLYVGANAGKILLNNKARNDLNEDHFSGGLLVGTDLTEFKKSVVALEADLTLPLASGSSDDFGAWHLTTAGLYGALRVGRESVFLKLKVGLVYEHMSVEAPGAASGDDLGLAPGLGLGARPANGIFVEIEAGIIDENMGYLRSMVGHRF